MARGRIISNAITGDKKINDLSDDTSRLAFTWLITFADVDGRTNGDPALLRSLLFPRRHDITIEQIEGYIREWQKAGLIIWYEANGDWYIAFPNFAKHQPWLRKDREADSIIPPPPIEQTNSDNSPARSPRKTPDNSPDMEAELRQNDGVPPSEWRHDSGLKEIKRDHISLTAPDGAKPEKPEEKHRKRIQEALQRGIKDHTALEDRFYSCFQINVDWHRKGNRLFLEWLKERPPGQMIEIFAEWWRTKDWRGKQGQPPTLAQIQELWPQAFFLAEPTIADQLKREGFVDVRKDAD